MFGCDCSLGATAFGHRSARLEFEQFTAFTIIQGPGKLFPDAGDDLCGLVCRATTGENLGPYPTQAGSNPPYPANTPKLVKDHSESDIRVDPTILGGLIVKLGSRMVDASLKTKLNSIKLAMKEVQ